MASIVTFYNYFLATKGIKKKKRKEKKVNENAELPNYKN